MPPKIKIEIVAINTVKENPKNPRIIKDSEFDLLVKSIEEFPEMLEIRPIVVNDKNIALGGNRRLKACKAAGLKKIPIIRASSLTEEQQRRFIIADNKSSGEWDYDMLRTWDQDELLEWGLDVPLFETDDSEMKDISDKIKSEFKIEIICKDETQQERVYNKLIADGYECRLLTL
jgi:ParB-like chromosome segregation protein Spo0J